MQRLVVLSTSVQQVGVSIVTCRVIAWMKQWDNLPSLYVKRGEIRSLVQIAVGTGQAQNLTGCRPERVAGTFVLIFVCVNLGCGSAECIKGIVTSASLNCSSVRQYAGFGLLTEAFRLSSPSTESFGMSCSTQRSLTLCRKRRS